MRAEQDEVGHRSPTEIGEVIWSLAGGAPGSCKHGFGQASVARL